MKKQISTLFVLLAVFLFSTVDIYSQWVAQTSGTTVRLRQIKAVNDNVVWACGASGVVLRTINGGTTWEVKTPTNSAVTNYSIDALDSLTAWVTGTVGGSADFTIWKTTDGGMTWTAQYNNSTGFSDGIRFFNANDGVCFADPDPWPSTKWEILVTTNGGNTWTRVPEGNYPPADSANGEYGAAGSIDVVGNNVWFSAIIVVQQTQLKFTNQQIKEIPGLFLDLIRHRDLPAQVMLHLLMLTTELQFAWMEPLPRQQTAV